MSSQMEQDKAVVLGKWPKARSRKGIVTGKWSIWVDDSLIRGTLISCGFPNESKAWADARSRVEAESAEPAVSAELTNSEMFYDGMMFLFLKLPQGDQMVLEIRGHGANLPQDAIAERVCALWNNARKK